MTKRLIAVCFGVMLPLLASCTPIVRERLKGPGLTSDATGFVFVYDDISATSVHLAGDFNRWGPNENGQVKQGDKYNVPYRRNEEGIWVAVIPYKEFVRDPKYDQIDDEVFLEHGRRYRYKIIVNLNQWNLDPTNRNVERDIENNTENSLLICP